MTYQTTLDRLYGLSWRGSRLGLERIREAAQILGNPQEHLRCVQIAGTNGKGSVAEMISAAAVRAGLGVGLYTSPHMHRFSERIKVNGKEMGSAALERHLSRALKLLDARPDLELPSRSPT
jgi:dihydrofolate synthase/folylpolyglutamate synthase